ncbi:DUF2336 domain-containing protein [Phenylobacterium aquaticum]|uniref:DUF2336 domain-containing protein n=1 Tax=Phenylobacterium aquaticum TaxID=1763816 RepID=UPI001F5CF772|nr:DUF2336 domain-containing protein [Phenylobacterium aquaticum]MCI3133780.1 DUF2336 domain-containing protein [Phenylobacterium aquaticum]
MSVAAKTQEILSLARSRAVQDRERLLLAIVDLCDAGDGATAVMESPPVQALLSSIFMSLVVEAERDIRRRLAEKLADAEWAPVALINVLALDDIEIARPVIASSPVLKDNDLVRLLVEATIEHQIEVARRPQLGAPVVAAILEQNEPAVLTALAGNVSAQVSRDDLKRLIGAARRIAALRTPLSRHPGLTDDLARELYVWVGQALRNSLAARFRLDQTALDAAIAESIREAHGGVVSEVDGTVVFPQEDERAEMEKRLLAKLDQAGQLRPGYLLRALREQKLSLFIGGLTTLGRFDPDQIRRAIDSDRPELLALACASVGIDRSVFPTILELVRELNDGHPGGGAEGARRAAGAFGPFAPDIARTAFTKALAKV